MKALLTIALLVAAAAPPRSGQDARVPVLVELFTSEGCATCPAADAVAESLLREQPVEGAHVLLLALHVDYFNHLGWKDRFSSRAFTDRQVAYSKVLGPDDVFTPQIVVDGRESVVGTDGDLVRRAIASAADRAHLPLGVKTRQAGGRVQLTLELPAAPSGAEPIHVMGAITQEGQSSAVTRGENGGRTLRHVSVARTVRRLDRLRGPAMVAQADLDLDRAWGAEGLGVLVWLQGEKSRQVYGSSGVPLAATTSSGSPAR